jgi:hypothetical protein
MYHILLFLIPTLPEVWGYTLVAVFSAIAALLGSWLNRKRRSTVRAEEHESHARARRLEVESIGDLLEQLRETRAEIMQLGRELQESRQQRSFLRDQVSFHEELAIRSRKAAHAAIDEIQRCLLAVRNHEDLMKEKGIQVDPFRPRSYDEITDYQSLPLPPGTRLLLDDDGSNGQG